MHAMLMAAIWFCASAPPPGSVKWIIPWPKEAKEAGAPAPAAGFRLLAGDGEKLRLAAEEINARLVELGGRPLPVSPWRGAAAKGGCLVIAVYDAPGLPDDLRAAAKRLGPQGYVMKSVRSPDGWRVFLVGGGAQGALYAAETCRQLLFRRGAQVMLQPADVRDWPDFKYRMHGMPFSEHLRRGWYQFKRADQRGQHEKARRLSREFVARVKRYVDWLLRAKINMMWNATNIRPGDAPANIPVVCAALKEIHDYARARGIESFCGDTTAIGTYPRDKDNPDFKNVVLHGAHRRYFCWSRLKYHRARAQRAAKFLHDAGYSGYYLHSTDGGGWQNPELWNDRCPLCRRTYGDDRAKADAAVFGTYYRAIKALCPNLKFVAVVYPYSGRYLDPDYLYAQAADLMGEGAAARNVARDTAQRLARFMARLNSLLPPDIFVCIRESTRKHAELAHRAWGKRRFEFYYEYAFWKGWRPIFITTPLWTRSLYFSQYDDILFSPMGPWGEMKQLLGVECSWNVNRPGARDFDSQRWRLIGTAAPCPPERASFARRGCRFLFGAEAASLIAPAYAENISFTYIASPQEVLRRLPIADPVKTMQEQAQATARAAASLDALWARQQRQPLLKGDRLGYFKNLYRMMRGARVLAPHQAHLLAARRAIRRSDRAAVQKELAADLAELKQAKPAWAALVKQIPLSSCLATHIRTTSVWGKVTHVDVDKLAAETKDLAGRLDRLLAAYAIPRWFARACRQRTLTAAAAAQPVVADGRLDEPAWAAAPVVEHFVDYRVLRLESLETQARLLYDGRRLYVGFTCFDPAPADIPPGFPGRDMHQLCDSVEVLLARRRDSKEFVHWIVDASGQVFDARAAKQADGRVKYSVKWNSRAQIAAHRGADRWTVEMAIPASEVPFPLKPGNSAAVLLCRNIVHTRKPGEEEQNAVVFLDGDGFHTVSKFARLRLARPGERPPAPQLRLVLRPMRLRHVTTGDGSGARVSGGLRLETDTNLHNASILARFSDGAQPLGHKTLAQGETIRLVWRPRDGFDVVLPRDAPGVVCTFEVQADEGRWSFTRKFGSPLRAAIPADRLFTAGVSGQAAAAPVFFPSGAPKTIDPAQGTIEFWVRPAWRGEHQPPGPASPLAHTFFNLGPVRPEYPDLSNYNSITISVQRSGALAAVVADPSYLIRTVAGSVVGWRAGQWRHVAFQWKADAGGETMMQLFVDGRLASDRVMANRPGRLRMQLPPLPIQIGAMNTGFAPADAAIDELRISSAPRYAGAFSPAKRFEPDARTLVLFHFDGTLEAVVPRGLKATPGSVK